MTAVFPTRLPVPITAIDGSSNGSSTRRVEAEVGADVREAGGERPRRPAKPLGRAEHRLVGEVDDDLGRAEAVDERHAVVARRSRSFSVPPTRIAPSHSYGSAASASRTTGAIVLPVDQRDGPRHRLAVTSRSIRPVYFSYSPVATSNWMIRSCPWNG